MSVETDDGPSLVPIERVACPTHENSDKATRKMIAQIEKTLVPRFPLEISGNGIEYQTMRFVTLRDEEGSGTVRAALRATSKDYQLNGNAPVDVISGMCLFGASGLTGVTESGRRVSLTDPYELKDGIGERIKKIVELPLLHPSEVESILRLTGAFRLLAVADGQNAEGGEVRSIFHLPVPEYSLYMLELFEKGVINEDQLMKLVEKVERRARDLRSMVEKRMPFDANFGSPLDQLNSLFATRGPMTTLRDCIGVLKKDPLFARLLEINPPQSFLDLANLSYSAGYMLISDIAQRSGNGCLAVEIAEEMPILEHAKRMSDAIGRPLSMAALYIPPSTISMTGRNGKQAPFMHEPNGDSPLAALVTVMRNSKQERM